MCLLVIRSVGTLSLITIATRAHVIITATIDGMGAATIATMIETIDVDIPATGVESPQFLRETLAGVILGHIAPMNGRPGAW